MGHRPDSENDPVAGALAALEKQLERIRQEHLVKNRPCLRRLTSEQQVGVEKLTAAITQKIFGEVARQVRLSAAQGEGRMVFETLSRMLGPA